MPKECNGNKQTKQNMGEVLGLKKKKVKRCVFLEYSQFQTHFFKCLRNLFGVGEFSILSLQ